MEAELRHAAEGDAAGMSLDLAPIGWTPPSGLGPIPAECVERARRIHTAQKHALGRMEEARASVAKHLAALEAVPASRDNGRAIYLDVTG